MSKHFFTNLIILQNINNFLDSIPTFLFTTLGPFSLVCMMTHSLLLVPKCTCYWKLYSLWQRFSTGEPQELLKRAIPNYLSRGADLFFLCQIKKWQQPTQKIANRCEWIKIILIFFVRWAKNIVFFWCAAEF